MTGGAGFIGSHLVDRLLARGAARVVVVDNFDEFYAPEIKRGNVAAHLNNPRYKLVEADIREHKALKELFSDEVFDAVIHLAAKAGVRPSVADPRGYNEVNVTGTINLLARELGYPRDPAQFTRRIEGAAGRIATASGSSSSPHRARTMARRPSRRFGKMRPTPRSRPTPRQRPPPN